jgi:hypothetical protein
MERAANNDEHELSELESELNVLRSLKSLWDTVANLKSSENPALEKQISELKEKQQESARLLEKV